MIQIGAILSGFSLYALFAWMPIWQMANATSAEEIFRYFIIVGMLMFGVFMTSGGKTSFSIMRFTPSFVAGVMSSMGYANETYWMIAAGGVIFAVFWIWFGE